MLLDDINVDHKATAFRTPFSWGLLLHNYLQKLFYFVLTFSLLLFEVYPNLYN